MSQEGIDAFLISEPVNIAYLTCFDGVFDGEDAHLVVVTEERATLYTDTRYFEAAIGAAEGSVWQIVLAKNGLYGDACDVLDGGEVPGRIGVESSVAYSRFKSLSDRWNDRLCPMDDVVEEIREVKDADEISRIAAAQELTDLAFTYIVERIRVGVTETEIALDLEFFMRRQGSQGVAFSSIVASGPNSAFPHASVTTRACTEGDFVKLDFGAKVDGYCADMTRTVVLGAASEVQRRIYQAVLEANHAGIGAVADGVAARAVDAAARAVITDCGYGELFGHGLGHGVGRQVHELPSVGPRAQRILKADSVITIEPGIYMPGLGGVRIEDLIVVGHGGAEVLTRSPKQLLEIA